MTVPGGMGGKETIGKLLEIEPKVKSIVSSGYSSDHLNEYSKEYGFVSELSKPYTISELKKVLHSVLTKTDD